MINLRPANVVFMKRLNRSDKLTQTAVIFSSALFIITSIVYFFPVQIPHKIAIPVGLIAITSILLCPWQITLALAFSAAGDYFGSVGGLLAQMGCFAISHIWFIIYFALRFHRKVEFDRKMTPKAKGFATMVLFCTTALLIASFTLIAPKAPTGILRIGTVVYTLLICSMLALALLQRSILFALGAILFVFSDFILAWNLFVEPIPAAGYLIMVPYYLAQWLLYIRSASFRAKPEIRSLRF